MSLSQGKSSRISILLRLSCLDSQSHFSTFSRYGELYSSMEPLSLSQRQRRGARRLHGGAKSSSGSTLSLSRLFHYHTHCSRHRSRCQVPCLLPHSSSFRHVQKVLLNKASIAVTSPLTNRNLARKFLDLNCEDFKGFCSVTNDNQDSDADVECDGDNLVNETETESVSPKSSADPNEVEKVCKVINDLFSLDRNMEAVLDECGISLSDDLVVDVLERFRHARRPAYRFFCWAGEKTGFTHDSRTYNSMMSILGTTRQFETMVSMLEEMGEKRLLTIETFKIAMNAFAAAKERKRAVAIFELMKKYKYKVGADTINCLLDSLGRAKLAKEAQVLFGKLSDKFTPNLMTYTVLLGGWCRVKNLMEAGRVWNEMIEKGFKPDIVAHNIMLEGLLKIRKRSDAIKLFEVMKAKGPSPNVRSYTIMIWSFCKQRKMKEAVEYFDEMLKNGYQADATVYTCLITGFGNQRKMDIVYELLREMEERGCPPDGHTYNTLIKLMKNQKMADEAARMYMKMVQSGFKPTIHTYNMLMKSCFQAGNYERGRKVWESMIIKGCCPDDNSYTVFIGGLISQGRSAEAYKYLEEMLDKGMKAPQLDYNKFAADWSRAGKPYVLEELARKMRSSGKFEVSNVFARWAETTKNRVYSYKGDSIEKAW